MSSLHNAITALGLALANEPQPVRLNIMRKVHASAHHGVSPIPTACPFQYHAIQRTRRRGLRPRGALAVSTRECTAPLPRPASPASPASPLSRGRGRPAPKLAVVVEKFNGLLSCLNLVPGAAVPRASIESFAPSIEALRSAEKRIQIMMTIEASTFGRRRQARHQGCSCRCVLMARQSSALLAAQWQRSTHQARNVSASPSR